MSKKEDSGITDTEILEGVDSFENEERNARKREQKAKAQQEIAQTELVHSDTKQIILPTGMSITKALRTLYEKKKQQETEVAIREVVDAWPLDGAVAFQSVLERKYGFVNQVPIPGFFGSTPPYQIGVRVDADGTTKQCNWGRMELSVLDHGFLETDYTEENGNLKFVIGGRVKKKFLDEVKDIAAKTRQWVREHSIYKSRAVRLDFRDDNGNRKEFNPTDSPEFIAIDPTKLDDVVYNDDVRGVVEMALLNPIKYPDACRAIGVPLKRGALLEGPFGTGKTLTAYQMAAHGTNNGFTFIYLMDVRDLDLAMRFAAHYAPAIVFAEDIDQIAKMGMRDRAEVNRLTNVLDGVDAKGKEIFTVFTTNYRNAIDGVFIRPGRIDAVVTLNPPDRDAAIRLVRKYGVDEQGNSIIDGNVTDAQIGESVECLVEMNANAAFLRETVERAKLSALPSYVNDGVLQLSASNIEAAALSMIPHLELQREQSPDGDGKNTMGEEAALAAIARAFMPPPEVFSQMMKAQKAKKTRGSGI